MLRSNKSENLTLLLCVVMGTSCLAGYRNVGQPATLKIKEENSSNHHVAEKLKVSLNRQNMRDKTHDPIVLQNNRGVFEQVSVEPNEEYTVVLSVDKGFVGSCYIYTINGGTIDGSVSGKYEPGADGEVRFLFKAGAYPGDCPVVVVRNGKQEILYFNVNSTPMMRKVRQ